MQHLIIALATTPTPAPSPSLRPGLSEDQVTPGTWGFILTAFVVVLTTLLIVDMVRRIRRVRYRAQVEEARLAAEGDTSGEAETLVGRPDPLASPDSPEGDGDGTPRRT